MTRFQVTFSKTVLQKYHHAGRMVKKNNDDNGSNLNCVNGDDINNDDITKLKS